MNTLEQLLSRWEDGTLTQADAQELKTLLAQPDARKELVDDWMFYEAIYGAFQARQEAVSTVEAAPAEPQFSFQTWLSQLFRPVWRPVAALMLVLALLAAWLLFGGQPSAQFTALQGPVNIERSGKTSPASAGQAISARDTIQVGPGASAVLMWPAEQTLVRLGPDSQCQLLRARGKVLSLIRGQLTAAVAVQPPGKPMVVRTPQAEAIVKGTRFALAASAQATRLEVIEGSVALHETGRGTSGRTLVVTPGNVAVAGLGGMQMKPNNGCALRELLAFPSGAEPFRQTGSLIWSEMASNLNVSGFPLGIAPAATNAYGQRLRGWLTIPATGDYAFWVSGLGESQFWLSPDDRSANLRMIASANGLNDRIPQKSAPQQLVGGQKYYFEVRHQISGNSSVAAGWVRPDASSRNLVEIIGGAVLSPWSEQTK